MSTLVLPTMPTKLGEIQDVTGQTFYIQKLRIDNHGYTVVAKPIDAAMFSNYKLKIVRTT
jgi:hypothetical protein